MKAKQALTGPKLIDLLRETFEVRGEELYRLSTGRRIVSAGRRTVFVKWLGSGRQLNLLYHRIKYAVVKGELPDELDHRNVDHDDNSIENLRPATRLENMRNIGPKKRKEPLPRCVYRYRKRFTAKINFERKQTYLGTFDIPEEASAVVEETLRVLHGEFYRCPQP